MNKFGKQRDVDLREASRIMLSVQAKEEKLSGEENNFNLKNTALEVTVVTGHLPKFTSERG